MIYVEEKSAKKVPGITSLFITFDFKPEIVTALKSLGCKVYKKKTKVWEVPIVYLSEVLDKLSLYETIELSLQKDKVKPNVDTELDISNYKTQPFSYQEEAIKYGLNQDKWLLLDPPGLGKTLMTILLAQELKQRKSIKHCLIVCGVNNLKFNWKKEIERHSNLDCLILGQRINKGGKLVIGSVKDRVDQLSKPIKEFFIITNIETLRESSVIKALTKSVNDIDMMVVDEIHCCKSPQSAQGKHLLKLTNFDYKIGLTGTMLVNDPLDAYVPLKWIGIEKSTYTAFKSCYCSYVGPFNNIMIGFKNINLLKYQLSQCSLRRSKDILDLPEKMIVDEIVEMDSKQSNFYENIKAGILDDVDKVEMTTTSLLSKITRLRQATACPTMLTTEEIDSAKIIRACELIDEIISNGNKVVVFSTFKETVYELQKKLNKYNLVVSTGDYKDADISQNQEKFQTDSECKIFLATWQKCGTGITLTAASYMIFIDIPWTYALFVQACDRIYRIGTKNKVTIYNLITKDTVDEKVYDLVIDKQAMSDYIIDNQINQSNINNLKKYILDLQK